MSGWNEQSLNRGLIKPAKVEPAVEPAAPLKATEHLPDVEELQSEIEQAPEPPGVRAVGK